jgi:putative oxidoreductase
MALGLLIIRVVVGSLFIGHGTQKLFGWFGGYGLDGTGGFLEKMGFRRGRSWAMVNGLSESMGGLLLMVGLLTPLGAAAIVGVMTVATVTVHLEKGVWSQNGGFELPIVYAGVASGVAAIGAGPWSVDGVLGFDLSGWAFGVWALGFGLLTGTTVLTMRRPAVTASPQDAEERKAA